MFATPTLLRKYGGGGGGGTLYTVTIGNAGPFYGYVEGGLGSISPNDGVVKNFYYTAAGNPVAILVNSPSVGGTKQATFNSQIYTLTDNGDNTYGYDDVGLGGPYPTSGTVNFTLTL